MFVFLSIENKSNTAKKQFRFLNLVASLVFIDDDEDGGPSESSILVFVIFFGL